MIRGSRVTLRALEEGDLERCWQWINDAEVTRYLGMLGVPVSLTQEREWLEGAVRHRDGYIMAIVADDGTHIGNIELHKPDWANRHASLGIMIGNKEYWGRGYGREAIQLLLGFAFRELGLNLVWLTVLDFNARAIRCYERVGFSHEGRQRQRVFREGEYHDLLLMSITREEYEARARAAGGV